MHSLLSSARACLPFHTVTTAFERSNELGNEEDKVYNGESEGSLESKQTAKRVRPLPRVLISFGVISIFGFRRADRELTAWAPSLTQTNEPGTGKAREEWGKDSRRRWTGDTKLASTSGSARERARPIMATHFPRFTLSRQFMFVSVLLLMNCNCNYPILCSTFYPCCLVNWNFFKTPFHCRYVGAPFMFMLGPN